MSSLQLAVRSRRVSARLVPVRIYTPQERTSVVLAFAHGGGFSWGTLDDYDQICRNLSCGCNAVVISVDYKLAPAHPFPEGFDDVYEAALWTSSNLAEFVDGPGKLVIAGDSAGACLAAGVAQRAAAERSIAFSGQLLIYPMIEYYDRTPTDFHTLSDRFHPSFEAIKGAWDQYLNGPVEVLPRYAVPTRTEDLSGLPPAFVLVAENDPLRFEGLRYGEAMKEAGVAILAKSYDGVAHSFLGEPPSSPKVGEALADISAWLQTL